MQNLFLSEAEPEERQAPTGSIALCVKEARKSFGKQQALRGINLTIFEGEQIALLGPNGAGKTTLVRTICGRCKLDSGSVEIFDRSIADEHALDLLGVVPQDLAIYGDLTAQENLLIFGRLHGLSGRSLKQTCGMGVGMDWFG